MHVFNGFLFLNKEQYLQKCHGTKQKLVFKWFWYGYIHLYSTPDSSLGEVIVKSPGHVLRKLMRNLLKSAIFSKNIQKKNQKTFLSNLLILRNSEFWRKWHILRKYFAGIFLNSIKLHTQCVHFDLTCKHAKHSCRCLRKTLSFFGYFIHWQFFILNERTT